jgi:hypothetical protein
VAAGAAPESLETDETSIALDAAIEDAPEPDAEEEKVSGLTDEEASMTAAVARLADEVRERGNWIAENDVPETAARTEDAVAVPDEISGEKAADGDTEIVTADPAPTLSTAEAGQTPTAVAADETPDTAEAGRDDVTAEFAYVPFGLTPAPARALAGQSTEVSPADDGAMEAGTSADEDPDDATVLPTAAEPEPRLASFAPSGDASTTDQDKENDPEAAKMVGGDVLPPVAEVTPEVANDDDPVEAGALEGETPVGLSGLGAALYSPNERSALDQAAEAVEHEDGIVEASGRIVIDATDDVLDFVPDDPVDDGTPAVAEAETASVVSVAEDAVEADGAETSDTADEDEKVDRHRPRFNPWS